MVLYGILSYLWRLPLLAVAGVLNGLLTAVANLDGNSSISGLVTPDDIIFNRIGLTNINYFDFDDCGPVILNIRQNVATWYYSIRILAIAILLVVLIYVGIRMATSSIASDQAKYKEMLKNWMVSFALVFVLHYIVIIGIEINNGLVDIIAGGASSQNYDGYKSAVTALVAKSLSPMFLTSHASLLLYFMIIGMTFVFLLNYIKRALTIGFLILIAPLITITYSIDKMGDGKSQALNVWLKEFLFNVLIQPFHGLIYIVFVKTAVDIVSSGSSFAAMIFSLVCMKFMWDAEKIVKQIFGFGQANSLSDTVASLAALKTVSSAVKSTAGKTGKVGGAASKATFGKDIQNPITKAMQKGIQQGKDKLKTSKLGQGVEKINDKFEKNRKSDNLAVKTAQYGLDKMGEMAKTMVTAPAKAAKGVWDNKAQIAIGAATWALAAGANDKNALSYGAEAFNTAKTLKDAKSIGKDNQEKVEETEKSTSKKMDEFAQRNGYQDYKNDPTIAENLQKHMEKILDKDMNLLDTQIQMTLNKLCQTANLDPSDENDAKAIGDIYEAARTADLTMTGMTAEYKAFAKAVQEKDLAQDFKSQQELYKEVGYSDPKESMKSFFEDFKNQGNG